MPKKLTKEEQTELEAEVLEKTEKLLASDLVTEENGIYTLTLKKPLRLAKSEVVQLVFRDELTGGDLEESEKSEGQAGQAIRLVASLTGIEYRNIRKMNASDLGRAALIVGHLSGNEEDGGIF